MTVDAATPRVKGYFIQLLMLILINVPTVSFGLAVGWVSLASGEGGESGEGFEEDDATLVAAAAATFAAGLVGVPLGARALAAGRKPAVIATSAVFGMCWALKLVGGWGVVAGRLAAGVAGAAAWCVAPLFAREMCACGAGGAAAAAPVLAHNAGVLLMYLAADAGLHHRTVLLWCLGLSAAHCCVFLLAPESPAFLAARGDYKAARASLAWLRGVDVEHPSLAAELHALPPPAAPAAREPRLSHYRLAKDMLSDRGRRRAFLIVLVAVVGQEACGVLTLMQFAERVFVLARAEGGGGGGGGASPARLAVALGAVQLVASAAALYLVERVGRRPLFLFGAFATGLSLCAGAAAVSAGGAWGAWGARGAAWALAAAVAADSLGLQPAPYAMLGDMFHYQYRGCAVVLVTGAASAANAAETALLPLAARAGGLRAALALAAAATLALAVFALLCAPETRARSPEQIYGALCGATPALHARIPKPSPPGDSSDDGPIVQNYRKFCPPRVISDSSEKKGTTESFRTVRFPRDVSIGLSVSGAEDEGNGTTVCSVVASESLSRDVLEPDDNSGNPCDVCLNSERETDTRSSTERASRDPNTNPNSIMIPTFKRNSEISASNLVKEAEQTLQNNVETQCTKL